MSRPFCPHCGADLVRDEPILIDDFSMLGMGYPLVYKDQPLDLTRSEVEICWSLMKGHPSMVKTEVILNRIGSEAETNSVTVQICRIRSKFREWGVPCPIGTERGYGYYWKAA